MAGRPTNSPYSDDAEAALQGLLTTWYRRQRWQHLLHCFQPPDHHVHESAHLQTNSPWRARLAAFLESNPVHLATIALLLVDVTLTVRDLVSCGRGGAPRRGEAAKWVGVGIMCVLATRIAALWVALGWSFFKRVGRVVDGLVVAVALLLEVVAKDEESGLLLVVSLWRVVRVVESAFELGDEAIEGKIESVVAKLEGLEEENKRLEEELKAKAEKIKDLERNSTTQI